MAGRGRGRGRGGGLSINIEAFGLGRGDILTPIQSQPPPLFPPAQFKPVTLLNNDELEYRLALKQELRDMFRKSPFYINPPKKVKDIERYSDKYQIGVGDAVPKLTPFWDRLPFELRERKKRKVTTNVKPNLKSARFSTENVEHLLDKLEKDAPANEETEDVEGHDDEDDDDEEKKKKEDEDEGDDEEGEEYDDEDLEEETDYNMAYFDNGEGYGDDDDDDDEGPTY